MNRVLRIKLLVVVLFTTAMCEAQVMVSTSQLDGTAWQLESRYVKGYIEYPRDIETIKFNMSSYTDSTYYSLINKDVVFQKPYYISNSEPSYTCFDRSKVGVNVTGKYIVEYNDKLDEVDYYTIISFNSDEMVLFHKAKEGYVPGLDVHLTYKRINKNE